MADSWRRAGTLHDWTQIHRMKKTGREHWKFHQMERAVRTWRSVKTYAERGGHVGEAKFNRSLTERALDSWRARNAHTERTKDTRAAAAMHRAIESWTRRKNGSR